MPYGVITQFAPPHSDNSAFGNHQLLGGSRFEGVDAFQLLAQAEVANAEAATPWGHTVVLANGYLNAASSQLAAAAGLISARVVDVDSDVFARIRQIIQHTVEDVAPMPKWQKFLLDPKAAVDVDAISETIESVFVTIDQYGVGAVELGKYKAEQVSGEHLAAILRATSSARDQIAGWNSALEIAAAALVRAGRDPADALFGMI
jgi:hypothetical protein